MAEAPPGRTALTCRDEGGCAARWAPGRAAPVPPGRRRGLGLPRLLLDAPPRFAHTFQNHSLRANVQKQPGQRPPVTCPLPARLPGWGFGPGCCRGLGDAERGRLSGKTVPRPQRQCSPRVLDFRVPCLPVRLRACPWRRCP